MPAKSEAAKQHANELCREEYYWYKDRGICPRCGKTWADAGKVYCVECYRKILYNKEKRDPGHNRHKSYTIDRRARLKELGLCTDCAERPAVEGKVRCASCQAKANEANRVYRIRQRITREVERARKGTQN